MKKQAIHRNVHTQLKITEASVMYKYPFYTLNNIYVHIRWCCQLYNVYIIKRVQKGRV